MTLPVLLPDPPVVRQDPARCWSAAFESWSRAQNLRMGLTPNLFQERLQEMFDGVVTRRDDPATERNERRGVLTTNRGSATDAGRRVLGGLGLMSMRRYEPNAVTPARVGTMLENSGYVYCAYYWGRTGHAIVIHGASAGNFDIMDPSRGLIRVPASIISGSSNRRVFLGVSLMPRLISGVEEALSVLQPPRAQPI